MPGGGEHGLHLRVLRVEHAAGEVGRQVRLVLGSSAAGDLDGPTPARPLVSGQPGEARQRQRIGRHDEAPLRSSSNPPR